MQRTYGAILLALMAGCGSGCATFRNHAVEPPLWPRQALTSRQSIRLVIKHDASVGGKSQDGAVLAAWDSRTVAAYRESGLFSNVDLFADVPTSDLTAEILVRYRSVSNPLESVAWGMTLMLYPMRFDEEIRVQTVLKDRTGKTLATVEKKEVLSTWFELFLVFAMPLNAPGITTSRVLYDLHGATLTELDRGPLRRLARAQNRFVF